MHTWSLVQIGARNTFYYVVITITILIIISYYYYYYYVPSCQCLTQLQEYKLKWQISRAYLLWFLRSHSKNAGIARARGKSWALVPHLCPHLLPWHRTAAGSQGHRDAAGHFSQLLWESLGFHWKSPSGRECSWIGTQCQIKPVTSNYNSISFQYLANYKGTCIFFLFLPHFPFCLSFICYLCTISPLLYQQITIGFLTEVKIFTLMVLA